MKNLQKTINKLWDQVKESYSQEGSDLKRDKALFSQGVVFGVVHCLTTLDLKRVILAASNPGVSAQLTAALVLLKEELEK